MHVLLPKNLDEFLTIVSKYNNSGSDYYRGQADFEWNITPSLARNKSITNLENLLEVEKSLIKQFEIKLIENNLKHLIPQSNCCDESWALVMAAQHYGLPTRLLDFTLDKFTAIEFAVADIENLKNDGALIVYMSQKTEDLSILKTSFRNDYDKSFFTQAPILYNGQYEDLRSESRKQIQGSKFFYRKTDKIQQCLALDDYHSNHLIKIDIPKTIKLDVIKWLIDEGRMAYDLYKGKNTIDLYAALLREKFNLINNSNIDEFLYSNNLKAAQ